MSADAGSYALENAGETRGLTWRESIDIKFYLKSKGCKCKPQNGYTYFPNRCRMINEDCDINSCPFVYWGCL